MQGPSLVKQSTIRTEQSKGPDGSVEGDDMAGDHTPKSAVVYAEPDSPIKAEMPEGTS